ncbi:hypothetical protein [Acinetobacter pragensis]|uniref:hypothetical protein n=1 Tax=Acinetobacter pragensis TaxID=1806892 RepID=UPI003342DECB
MLDVVLQCGAGLGAAEINFQRILQQACVWGGLSTKKLHQKILGGDKGGLITASNSAAQL